MGANPLPIGSNVNETIAKLRAIDADFAGRMAVRAASIEDLVITGLYADTIAEAPNVHVDSDGVLTRSTDTGGDLMHVEEDLSGAVTITTAKAVVANQTLTLSAGNIYKIEFMFLMLNDSGAGRTYTVYLDIGTVFSATLVETTNPNATQRNVYRGEFWLTLVSSSEAQLVGTFHEPLLASAEDTWNRAVTVRDGWDNTTSDVTGSQDISIEIASNNDATTQTAYPGFLIVREMPIT